MNTSYTHAPHRGGSDVAPVQAAAPNAALLIDFDNVTMGMRSDLSKDLRKLLQSDIIRGKVTVQRAYADWRRYPQYIVPLSENSIDLIFAPAYGSSKKNATDIRMAIDGMELVFTRPEIGTYILLTGDSDFSSLVLKLKEYGKYVIGVGIQESSSDILVQNCDEYYSYTNLAGLQKTSDADGASLDPWVLVEKSVQRMASRDDVMRSDRLKQVMMELDPGFDEGNFGYSKFSKFLTEAASKGLVQIKKMENGQYEIAPTGGGGSAGAGGGNGRKSRSDDRGGRRGGGRESRRSESRDRGRDRKAERSGSGGDPLKSGYELLLKALDRVLDDDEEAVRDSDVKRRMLEIDRSFDEAELGFSKFSIFLKQADDDGVIRLHQRESGNYEVSRPADAAAAVEEAGETEETPDARQADTRASSRRREEEAAPVDRGEARESGDAAEETSAESEGGGPAETVTSGRRLGPRRGSTRRRSGDEGPVLFEGQAVSVSGSSDEEEEEEQVAAGAHPRGSGEESRASSGEGVDAAVLGLPTDPQAVKRYLANRYKGVGVKTAETVVDELGDDVFEVLRDEPEKIRDLLPANRADTLLDAWRDDYERRTASLAGSSSTKGAGGDEETRRGGLRRRTRRGRR